MRLIIDSQSLAYKTIFHLADLSFAGRKTGVIFGFLSQIKDLAEKFNTNQFVFCWDSRQSYRKMIDPGYKNRPPDEKNAQIIADARIQFNQLREEILPTMGFKNVFMQTGYESDDLIAWIVARYPDEWMIVTGDDDLLQLLLEDRFNPIKIYNLTHSKVITEQDFMNKYRLPDAKSWTKVKGYAGCSSDTVTGIVGVGLGTAINYLNGSLKDGKIKQKIESPEGQATYKHCFDLVALPYRGDRDINVPELIDDQLYSLPFFDIFKQCGLGSFVKNFEDWKRIFNLIPGR